MLTDKMLVYEICDPEPRYWLVREGRFVAKSELPENSKCLKLYDAEGQSSEELLQATLREYGFPLGQFENEEDRLARMLKENKEYLLYVLFLYAMDVEVPKETLKKFSEMKEEFTRASGTAISKLLEE